MKPLSLAIIFVVAIGAGIVIIIATRKPTVSVEINDMGSEAQRDTRDAYNHAKELAEDTKAKAKD